MPASAAPPPAPSPPPARSTRIATRSAYPNRLIVALADQALQRNGRMVRAIEQIGPGDLSLEGQPFQIELE